MKRFLTYVFTVMIGLPAMSQAVITHTVNVSWNDNLSKNHYRDINTENNKLTGKLTANTAYILGLKSMYEQQYNDLKTVNTVMASRARGTIAGFVNGTTFSNNVYQSMGYINSKYPLINLNPGDSFRNLYIRTRYSIRLNQEKKRVENYVNTDNPIPEGERIYLILSTIENVLKIAIQDEEF